jgi:hypothetical protein
MAQNGNVVSTGGAYPAADSAEANLEAGYCLEPGDLGGDAHGGRAQQFSQPL